MTISGIGSGGPAFQTLSSADEGMFNSFSGRLAVLVLEHQEQQKQLEQAEQASARADFRDAVANEVDALRDQADSAFRGAVVQGALSAAAACFSFANAGCKPNETTWKGTTAGGLSSLAQPIGALAGNTYGAADAKAAEGRKETAKDRIDDARDAIKSADNLQDKATDWVSSMVDRDAATTSAILSNKV
jgi:hypothetical protein